MARLDPTLRRRIRRTYLGVLFALGLEVAVGVFVWHEAQWQRLIIFATFPTLLLAMAIGVVLAGERWTIVGDFTVRHPSIVTALIVGIAAATMLGFMIGPIGIIIGPFVLGFAVLVGWSVQKARGYLGT